MGSDTRSIKVYLPQIKEFRVVRVSYFREYQGTTLPEVQVIFDGIAKQVEKEIGLQLDENAESMPVQALFCETNT